MPRLIALLPVLLFLLLTLLPSSFVLASAKPVIPNHGVSFSKGNLFHQHTDLSLPGLGDGLNWTRSYNSQSLDRSILGYGWTFTANSRLIFDKATPSYKRADGRTYRFKTAGTNKWTSELYPPSTLTKAGSEYTLVLADTTRIIFNDAGQMLSTVDRNGFGITLVYANGLLHTVTDSQGRSCELHYNGDGLLSNLETPVGFFEYAYDANDNLISVTRPDGIIVQYVYGSPEVTQTHLLTGIRDGTGALIQSIGYDDQGRVINSSLEGGIDPIQIEYLPDYKRIVSTSDGDTLYELQASLSQRVVKEITAPPCTAPECGDNVRLSYVFNSQLQLTRRTDANGNQISYTSDTSGYLKSRNRAAGTADSYTTSYTWNSTLKKITARSEPSQANAKSKSTNSTYDTAGNLLNIKKYGYVGSSQVNTTTSYQYNSLGQLLTIDGPRTDVQDITSLSYYPNFLNHGHNRGQLHTITNALGQVFEFGNYTVHGKPQTITLPDGQVVALTYDLTGNVLTRSIGGLVTFFEYDAAGRVTHITLPGNRTLAYTYTNGLLSSITDGLGNTILYQYDARGREISKSIGDSQGLLNLKYTLGRAYDAHGNLSKFFLSPDSAEVVEFQYDGNKNLLRTIDPVGTITEISHDGLNRPKITTVADRVISSLTYDRGGNLNKVADSREHNTTYTIDDFDRIQSIQSPDTGLTKYSYDPAGNLISRTDAKNQVTQNTYDALNRPVQQNYPGAARPILLTWDFLSTGRLGSIQAEYSDHSFSYNTLGQVTAESRSIGSTTATVSYGYDTISSDLTSITYPSGRVLSYTRDSTGRINEILLDGQPLATNIKNLPFGPEYSKTLGATTLVRSYDQRYQLTRIQAGQLDIHYTLDAAGRVTIADGIPEPTVEAGTWSFFIEGASNRIYAVGPKLWQHDANGNLIFDGVFSYIWDALNRLIRVEQSGAIIAAYAYDAQNRRISKTAGEQTIHYHYDLDSRLIAETLSDGTPVRDYFYLDNEPLAVREYRIQENPGLYYFINDRLGAPIQLITPTGTVVWQAAYFPYGEAEVQVNTISNNLRFPGQYYDVETELHYNWNRYYDPMSGRYISPDPIGLEGGLNLYAYVGGNPVNWVDREGLKQFEMTIWAGGGVGHFIIGGGIYNVTIRDLSSGQSTLYTMVVLGLGVGYPAFRGSSKPIIFNDDDCKKSDRFYGFGYIGGISLEAVAGFKAGGGIKIPNGPFIPGSLWPNFDIGGVDIGVSHNATYWYR